MEIIQERLDREFNMDVITTVPNVSFQGDHYEGRGNRCSQSIRSAGS